ncbi:MAG: 16S rRNA (adenine(1518)-N(6)/adenine(1519)-N(6))-dimethyltransferase RsmA [Rikenellaceae bacterium]|nr:16S rRNA (adenine(1518)-N(6)/adenine(1519)-N(6))-dimethyltransferase RsmA [Rikenellaceae bacterium]
MEPVRAKKQLGQHFLTDLSIARRICDSLTGFATGNTLEVGPGMGVLTQFLLERDDIDLKAAEVDRESVDYLLERWPDLAPRIIHGDFLRLPLDEMFPDGVNIIGNFPYNISSQIFFKVLENRNLVSECVGMVQKEVAVRIAEKPGTRDYGILSVFLQAYYDIEYLFTVHENVFNPPPKVKSAVIRLTRNDRQSLGCDEKLFAKTVKGAFGQRRKTLRNSLRATFPEIGDRTHDFFSLRPERLSVEDFVELTLFVEKCINDR